MAVESCAPLPLFKTSYLSVPRLRVLRGAAPQVDAYYAKGEDHGATHYYHMTESALKPYPAWSDRIPLGMYLAIQSVKLKPLLGMAHDICTQNARKLLICTEDDPQAWMEAD